MKAKIVSGYIIILGLSFLIHATKPGSLYISLLPLSMLIFPLVVGYRVKLSISLQDVALGLGASLIFLTPYHLLFGGPVTGLTLSAILFQIAGVAFPEEFFFRGFLQDSIGKNYTAVLLTSLLFAAAHLPKAVFGGDWIALLSFFPSLVMGWLYMRANNILPGVIFHFIANLVSR